MVYDLWFESLDMGFFDRQGDRSDLGSQIRVLGYTSNVLGLLRE